MLDTFAATVFLAATEFSIFFSLIFHCRRQSFLFFFLKKRGLETLSLNQEAIQRQRAWRQTFWKSNFLKETSQIINAYHSSCCRSISNTVMAVLTDDYDGIEQSSSDKINAILTLVSLLPPALEFRSNDCKAEGQNGFFFNRKWPCIWQRDAFVLTSCTPRPFRSINKTKERQ